MARQSGVFQVPGPTSSQPSACRGPKASPHRRPLSDCACLAPAAPTGRSMVHQSSVLCWPLLGRAPPGRSGYSVGVNSGCACHTMQDSTICLAFSYLFQSNTHLEWESICRSSRIPVCSKSGQSLLDSEQILKVRAVTKSTREFVANHWSRPFIVLSYEGAIYATPKFLGQFQGSLAIECSSLDWAPDLGWFKSLLQIWNEGLTLSRLKVRISQQYALQELRRCIRGRKVDCLSVHLIGDVEGSIDGLKSLRDNVSRLELEIFISDTEGSSARILEAVQHAASIVAVRRLDARYLPATLSAAKSV